MGLLYTRKIAVYVAIAVVLFTLTGVCKLIFYKESNTPHKSADQFQKNTIERNLVFSGQEAGSFHSNNAIGMKNVLEMGNNPTEIPEHWEKPLMDILLNDKCTPEDRVRNLYEMAVVGAKGVPRVQEECLNHLLYTIPDEQTNMFNKITTNDNVPSRLREDFLKKTLAMRPESLCVPLCESLMYNQNNNLVKLCTQYLQDVLTSTNTEN